MSLKDAMQKFSEQTNQVERERNELAAREQAQQQAEQEKAAIDKRIIDDFLKTKLQPAFQQIKTQFNADGLSPEDFVPPEQISTSERTFIKPIIGLVFCMPHDKPDLSRRNQDSRVVAPDPPLVWISFAVLRHHAGGIFCFSPNARGMMQSRDNPHGFNQSGRREQSQIVVFGKPIRIDKLPSITTDDVDSKLGEMLIHIMNNIGKLRSQ